MATVVGSAEVLVWPSFRGFQTNTAAQMAAAGRLGANSYAQATQKAGIGKRIGSAIGGGLLTTAKVTGGAVAGVLSLSLVKGFQRLNSIEQARAKLRGLGHDADDVKKIMNNALKSVKGTAFGLDEAATVSASAVAAGIKPGKELTKYLKLTADAATIAGSSLGDMGDILNQVAAAGKANNGNLEQLSQRGIPIYQLLGKTMHKTAGEVFDLAAAGKVSSKDFQEALHSGVAGAALTAGNTVQGSFKNMGAALSRFGAAFLDKLFPRLQKGFVNLTTFLDNATKAVGPLATVIGDKLGGAFVRVTGVLARLDFGSWDKFVASLTGGRGSGAASTVGRIASGIVTFGKSVKTYIQGLNLGPQFARLWDSIKGMGPQIGNILRQLPSAASGTGKGVLNFLSTSAPAFQTFGSVLQKIGTTAGSVFAKSLSFINDHFNTLVKLLPVIVAGWIAYRGAQKGFEGAQLAVNAAQLKALPITLANNLARIAAEALARSNRVAIAQETAATEENTVAKSRGLVTMVRTAAVWVAQRTAMLASAVAQKAATAAQWAMNIAMDANPIGLIIIGIAALVAGLVLLATKTTWGRKIVSAAWTGIKSAAVSVFHWFTRSFVPFFTTTLPNAFQATIGWIRKHWPIVLGILTGPIGLAVGEIIKHRKQIEAALRAAWTWVSGKFRALWSGATHVLTAPIRLASSFFSATLGAGGRARGIFNSMHSWATGAFSRLWNGVKYTFTHPIDAAKNSIQTILGRTGLQKVFRGAVTAFGRIWAGIKKLFADPVKWIVSNVIDKVLIAGINKIGNFVGLGGKDHQVLAPISVRGLATGGVFMPHRYTPGRDIGLAALSGSEAIMRPEFTHAVGGRWVDSANKAAREAGVAGVKRFLGGYARGGIVKPTRSGRINPSYPGHSGVDFYGRDGDPIFATTAGRIIYEGSGRGYGNAIFEQAANGLEMVYGHTSRFIAHMGQMVRAGQEIGLIGHSGNVRPAGPAGAHLHFEIAPTGQFDLSSNRQATLNWLGGSSIVSRILGGIAGLGRDLLDPSKLLTSAVHKALAGAGDVLSSPFGHLVGEIPTKLAGQALNWAKSRIGNILSPGGAGVEQWRGTITTALAMNGLPTTPNYVNRWLRQVGTESSGDPRRTQQIRDANSARGMLAEGLLQVLPSTFRQYMFPGHGNIWNPLDNSLAAIHYALSRYGREGMLRAIGAGHGYADGTLNATRGWHLVGEREPEWVNFRGGEQVYNGQMVAAMAGRQSRGPSRISGTLDLGNGLKGYVEGIVEDKFDREGSST